MEFIEILLRSGFVDLGFAEWESGRGLQIQNLDVLDPDAPGVYVMHHEGSVQKVGKSSASLKQRLLGYRRFDRESLAGPGQSADKSSQKQRRAISELSISGLSVLTMQCLVKELIIPVINIRTQSLSFDPHDLEKKLLRHLRKDKTGRHSLSFGS